MSDERYEYFDHGMKEKGRPAGRPKGQYDYRSVVALGKQVTGYTFAKYMGMPYYQVKNMIKAGKIHRYANGLVANPALDPKLRDAEWMGHEFVVPFPGFRSGDA